MHELTTIETIETKILLTKQYTTQEYVGLKVKEYRKSMKLKQLEVANAVGVSRSSMSNMEMGKQIISIEYLQRLCKLFKCKSSDILPF